MERYNPFAADSSPPSSSSFAAGPGDDPDPFSSNPIRRQLSNSSSSNSPARKELPISSAAASPKTADQRQQTTTTPQRQSSSASSSRYSTSFPDPFGPDETARSLVADTSPVHSKLAHHSNSPAATSSKARHGRQTTFNLANSPSYASGSGGGGGGVNSPATNRSNSVTFLHRLEHEEGPATGTPSHTTSRHPHLDRDTAFSSGPRSQRGASGTGGGGGFGSFLSRATSVTSSSVTDRVTGAVGSMRSAVDSLSTQIQSAVPTNLGGPGMAGMSSAVGSASQPAIAGGSGGLGQSLPVISRQRVVLILDSLAAFDWAAQFHQYRRLIYGLNASSSSTSSAMNFTSFLASQFSSSGGGGGGGGAGQDGGADLIEQADFGDVSVMANQASSTVTVYVGGASALAGNSTTTTSSAGNRLMMLASGGGGGSASSSTNSSASACLAAKIVRPEFVVVRQRVKERLEHLRSVVKALDYCLVPMFEPYEVWNIFQDRQLIFAKLLRVQKQLGKEQFPLIPQIYCQTHQDLLNFINNMTTNNSNNSNNSGSSIPLPCLVRTGPLGRGKIKIESLQMLRDFATIMATSQQSCTIEQYLDVKCDLIVQRLGTSLKLFRSTGTGGSRRDSQNQHHQQLGRKESNQQQQQQDSESSPSNSATGFGQRPSLSMQQSQVVSPSAGDSTRSAATRQSSLGGGMLSSLISSTSSGLQQVTSSVGVTRRTSNPPTSGSCAFEKLSDVSARHRDWVEAIAREFEHKIDAFSLKIVVARNDREYIVGLRNCSMDFLGNQENQEEDRRSFVELVMSKMNTVLPKHHLISRESSSAAVAAAATMGEAGGKDSMALANGAPLNLRRTSSDDERANKLAAGLAADKKSITFMSQTDVMGQRPGNSAAASSAASASSTGQAHNRSRSVSMNQGDQVERSAPGESDQPAPASTSRPAFQTRRSSDRASGQLELEDDSMVSSLEGLPGTPNSANYSAGLSQRQQSSLGQSIFEQTSSAFGSLHKQSMSFLKRLDSRTGADFMSSAGGGGGTPPTSAKSDTAFDRKFSSESGGLSSSSAPRVDQAQPMQRSAAASNGAARAGGSIKSQSVDASSASLDGGASSLGRPVQRSSPPKPPPPPPQALMNRQSSLANYSSSSAGPRPRPGSYYESGAPATPSQTPRQNSSAGGSMESMTAASSSSMTTSHHQRQPRVTRQNSALSAFEPFDPDLRAANQQVSGSMDATDVGSSAQAIGSSNQQRGSIESTGSAKLSTNRRAQDAGSVTSGNSDETTTAEDTMNNLKKTFASIFGDKCD